MAITGQAPNTVVVCKETFEGLKEASRRASTLESLLQDCLSTMDNCHSYDTDSYRAANQFLYGGEEE